MIIINYEIPKKKKKPNSYVVAIEEGKTLEVSWMLFFCFEEESHMIPKCVSMQNECAYI